MNPLITDEMVEAATVASINVSLAPYGESITTTTDLQGGGEALAEMRAALEAVIPQIAKEVWYDGFEAGATWIQYIPPNIPNAPPLNPYEEKL